MKSRIVLYIMIIGLLASLFHCTDKPVVEDQKIEVEANFSNLADLQIGDYFRSVRYLPLETHDSCLIGANPAIYLFKDQILINSNSGSYLFDKKMGNSFIRSDISEMIRVDTKAGFPGWIQIGILFTIPVGKMII